jgi:hypothetical protein
MASNLAMRPTKRCELEKFLVTSNSAANLHNTLDIEQAMSSWASLPAELRLMVLSHLIDDDTKAPYTNSLLATVCREWQWFFEKRNFRELVLSQRHLNDFDRLLKRKHSYRLAYVKKLRFKVLLDKYDCDSCQTGEDEPTIRR